MGLIDLFPIFSNLWWWHYWSWIHFIRNIWLVGIINLVFDDSQSNTPHASFIQRTVISLRCWFTDTFFWRIILFGDALLGCMGSFFFPGIVSDSLISGLRTSISILLGTNEPMPTHSEKSIGYLVCWSPKGTRTIALSCLLLNYIVPVTFAML